MEAVQRVLPSVNIISSEKSAKDPQHKKQAKYKTLQFLDNKYENEQIASTDINTLSQTNDSVELERRIGVDRRLSAITRGRWLESRNKKDRRIPIIISLRI
ncbi:MAG: hypothetical protein MJK12_14175 [Colwellia sp.]|nr:hypothetical protein [Colwellia sp.]